MRACPPGSMSTEGWGSLMPEQGETEEVYNRLSPPRKMPEDHYKSVPLSDCIPLNAEWCISLSAYHGNKYEDELSFEEGQRIKILQQDPSGWWKGEMVDTMGKRSRGVFPKTYVGVMQSEGSVDIPISRELEPELASFMEAKVLIQFIDILPLLVLNTGRNLGTKRITITTIILTVIFLSVQYVRFRRGAVKVFPKLWQMGIVCILTECLVILNFAARKTRNWMPVLMAVEISLLALLGIFVDNPFIYEIAEDIIKHPLSPEIQSTLEQSTRSATWAWIVVLGVVALLEALDSWTALGLRIVLLGSGLVLTYRWLLGLGIFSYTGEEIHLESLSTVPTLGYSCRQCMPSVDCLPPTPRIETSKSRTRRRVSQPVVIKLTSPTSVARGVPDNKTERYSTMNSIGADSNAAEYFTFERT
ncbi:hypothetical protein AAMO2058_000190300 [Amorphochlora amoebiformis]